ncbi:MAG: thiamine pyrophosphate-binding protein [Alphaproteobacteria bacterium]|nr:thiamine pyrophosphate-binding protein [Alphaproteobacteria bacterium]
MTQNELTAVDRIAQRLYDAGCRYAFGIPGGEVIAMIEALDRAGIRFILTKHENNAGFMAEGTYHLTGAPGILVATIGPGAANGFNVVANAEQDRVPLIVLTGCVDPEEALTYNHQVFDHGAVFQPVTKAQFTLADGAADILADKAVALAMDQRPGPVHIDLPIGRQKKPAPGSGVARRAVHGPTAPATGPDLDRARGWLKEAKNPLMIAGLDILTSPGGAEAVRRAVEECQIPLITSYKAKGILQEDHPLALGGAGLSPTADKVLMPLIAEADLLLLIGYDPIEMRTGWRNAWSPETQRVVEIASAANDHYMHQSEISFVCDPAAGLSALTDGVTALADWSDRIPTAREALAGAFGQNEAWGPAAIVETVRAALPKDGIATVDSGAHRILLSQVWRCFDERQLLQSTGLCTMGCALPLAAGAKIAAPERPVVCFTGDAGLEMILGELATLRDLKLAVPVIVFTDQSLALIELKQRNAGMKNLAVDFDGTDFEAVGKAMGGHGVTVTSRRALTEAMESALAAETFTVISCVFERKAYDGRL